jgi:hypothetical protein
MRSLILLLLLPLAGAQTDGLEVHEFGFLVEAGVEHERLSVPDLLGDLPSHVRSEVKDSPLDGARAGDPRTAAGSAPLDLRVPLPQTITTADPLIFFYSDRPCTVDVTVRFDDGRPIAWFPRVDAYRSRELVWEEVGISPRLPRGRNLKKLWDEGGKGKWRGLFRARKLRGPCYVECGTQVEKYLFYEAAVNYPLTLLVNEADPATGVLTLENVRDLPLLDLYVLPGHARDAVAYVSRLEPGARLTVDPTAEHEAIAWLDEDLPEHLRDHLAATGLHENEATLCARMVLEAPFMRGRAPRALYRLPQEEYAQHYHLSIEPPPATTIRVGLVLVPDLHERSLQHICQMVAAGRQEQRRRAQAALQVLGSTGREALQAEIPRRRGVHRRRLEAALQELE